MNQHTQVQVSDQSYELGDEVSRARIVSAFDLPEDEAGEFPQTPPQWKRVLDISLIILSMPLWLPLMVFLVLLVKIVSPGPVFFRQERVGYRGRCFMILKFRSMKVNVDTCLHEQYFKGLMKSDRPMTKLDETGDSRLIPMGKILRATGLDELPQIFNVLRGEMSLVGPRPCTTREFANYEPWQKRRVYTLPGLTGLWQVNGKNKTTFSEMISMDIFYAKRQTWRMDLAIILKTIPALAGQVFESRAKAAPAAVDTINQVT